MQLELFELSSTKTPLIYPGGKSRAWKHFKKFLPTDVKKLVSPFIGGGAIELKCSGSGIKVIASDNFEPLVNFWIEFQKDSGPVIDLALKLLPLSYDERLHFHHNFLKKECVDMNGKVLNDLERAAHFFVINRCSYSGLTFSTGPHSENFQKANAYPHNFENFRGWENNNIEFSLNDYKETLNKYNGNFMFIDPPYVDTEHLYGAKMEKTEKFDHYELRDCISKLDNKWILCYKEHDLITELYKDYNIFKYYLDHGVAKRGFQVNKKSEVFIMNF